MTDDATLVQEAARGSRDAFRALYERHRPVVARLAEGFGGLDADEVADVVQDSFIRAFNALSRLRDPGQFRPWVLQIARNRCLSRYASRQAEGRAVNELAHFPAENVQPAQVALAVEQEKRIVRELIDALPDGAEKRTVQLFYLEGEKSLREIAELQHETKSAVAMRLERFRARFKLKLLARLGEDVEDEPRKKVAP